MIDSARTDGTTLRKATPLDADAAASRNNWPGNSVVDSPIDSAARYPDRTREPRFASSLDSPEGQSRQRLAGMVTP